MFKKRRLEAEPPIYLLNDGLFFAIDRSISEAPVYFRQKDAETYFDNPFLLGYQVNECFRWAIRYRWFSPRYRPIRFDCRQLRPYTNKELLSLFGYTYDGFLEQAKYYDDWDFFEFSR